MIVKCQLNYNEVKVTNRMDDILYIELDFQNRNFVNKKDTNKVKNLIYRKNFERENENPEANNFNNPPPDNNNNPGNFSPNNNRNETSFDDKNNTMNNNNNEKDNFNDNDKPEVGFDENPEMRNKEEDNLNEFPEMENDTNKKEGENEIKKNDFFFDPFSKKPGEFLREEKGNLFESFKNNNSREFQNEYFSMNIYDNIEEGNTISSMSKIDFHKCEEELIRKGIIDKNESLIILQMDINRKDQLTNQIEYQLFFNNGSEVNLSLCKNVKINIISNVNTTSINDLNTAKKIYENKGYDIFNYNDSFYNDICTPFTSENKTDLTLNDRKNLIYGNYSFCEDNCTYNGYNFEENTVNCSCDVKEEVTEDYSQFNVHTFSKKVFNIFSDSNFKVIKCYNLVFSVYTLKKNIGSHMIISLGIIQIILVIFFFRNPHTEKNHIYGTISKIQNEIKKDNNNNNINIDNSANKKLNTSISVMNKLNKTNSNNDEVFKKKDVVKYVSVVINNYKKNNANKIYKYKSKDNNLPISKKSSEKFQEKIKIEEKEKFSEKQMNNFTFEEAIKYDKRDFIDYYSDKLKLEQTFIFTFFTTDHNNKHLKIILFVFYISMFISFNALFFSDSNISHINQKSGKYDFIYFLPKSIASSLFCAIINALLKLLALNEKRRLKNLDEYIKFQRIKKIKLVFFFSFQLIFFSAFWYFTSAFCIVYHNTQKHLIKDSLVSFLISMILPFFLVVISGMFRIIGIKRKNKILFKIANFIEIF